MYLTATPAVSAVQFAAVCQALWLLIFACLGMTLLLGWQLWSEYRLKQRLQHLEQSLLPQLQEGQTLLQQRLRVVAGDQQTRLRSLSDRLDTLEKDFPARGKNGKFTRRTAQEEAL
jgi:hypothetical protein